MNYSSRQFVYLLENLLVFHAMYKCGPAPLFGPGSSPSDANDLLLLLRKLVAQIITYCPRQEGNKWKLQKLHELLHFPLMLFFFCHAKNFDAGSRERHLKDVFKDVAKNSQQRGQDTFLHQVGAHMHEKLMEQPSPCNIERIVKQTWFHVATNDNVIPQVLQSWQDFPRRSKLETYGWNHIP